MLNILANAVRGTGNMTLPGFVIMGSVDRTYSRLAAADFRAGDRYRRLVRPAPAWA